MSSPLESDIPGTARTPTPDAAGPPPNGGSILAFEARTGFDAAAGTWRKIPTLQLPAEPRTADLIRLAPDREWKTLCLLATRADERGLTRLGEDEIATLLGVSTASARSRVKALEGITFEGRPLVKVRRDRLRDDEHTYVLYTVNLLPLPPLFFQEELFPRTEAETRAAMDSVKSRAESAAAAVRVDRATATVAPAAGEAPRPGAERLLKAIYARAEERLARPLSSKEIIAIQEWHIDYGFPPEIISELLEEGLSRGTTHLSYLQAVARRWRDGGVRTLEDVARSREEYLQATSRYAAVLNCLNLGRRLTQPEIDLLDKWHSSWGFSEEVILKACATTVNINRPNFRYIDQVLANWRAAGVTTVEAAERRLAEFEEAARRGGDQGASQSAGRQGRVASGQGRTRARDRLGPNFQVSDGQRDEEYYEQFFTRYDRPGKGK